MEEAFFILLMEKSLRVLGRRGRSMAMDSSKSAVRSLKVFGIMASQSIQINDFSYLLFTKRNRYSINIKAITPSISVSDSYIDFVNNLLKILQALHIALRNINALLIIQIILYFTLNSQLRSQTHQSKPRTKHNLFRIYQMWLFNDTSTNQFP